MKINKLAVLICMLFLLNISIVFALDTKPFFVKFEAVSTNVRDTADFQIQVYDSGTNNGIEWIRLYEGTTMVAEKICGGSTSCSWNPQVSHPEGGSFSYHAKVKDNGPNIESSGSVTVDYVGDFAPQYFNLTASPASGSLYNASQIYTFEIEWVDDWNEINEVLFEHNFSGFFQNETISAVGNLYSYSTLGIVPGDYTYQWHASDLSGNENSTPLQNYSVVAKNPSTCSLVFDTASPITYGTAVNASCSCTNPEASAVLWRNGTDVTATENNQAVVLAAGNYDYVCNVTETANYGSASNSSAYIINKAPSVVDLTLNGVHDNVTVYVNDSVDILGTLVQGEGNISLYLDGALDPNSPEPSPISQVATFASPVVANITLVYDQTQNYSASSDTLFVTVLDSGANMPPVVTLLSPLNATKWFGDVVTFGFNVTDDNSSTLNCALWENSTGVLADSGVSLVATNNNVAYLNHTLPYGEYEWNILCDDGNLTAFAPYNFMVSVRSPDYVIWDNPSLDLGNGIQGAGALTGNDNLIAYGSNTNVTVSCLSGNCAEITDDWTDGTNMADGENQSVIFTCDDSTAGNYSAVFGVVSNENNYAQQITISCNILPSTIATTGNVVINEFLADGVVPTTEADEFIELYNNDSIIIDVSGWNLGDSASNYTIPASTIMNPGDFLAYNRSVSGIALNNGGDSIYLYNSTGDLIDSYTFTSATENVSEGRYPDGSNLWLALTSLTPGAANIYVQTVYVEWNQTVLDLGSGEQGDGVLTGTADITSTDNNTDVAVSCSGDCTEITDDWTVKNMTDGESQVVTFTCDDSAVGNYSAVFSVASNEDSVVDQISVSCEITAPTNNQPYFISPAVNANIQVNNTFLYDVDTGDADAGDVLTHYDDAAQFDIDPNLGYINFTPTIVEVITATITVCDDSGLSNNCTTQPFVLNVTPGPTNNAPTFLTAPVDTSIEENNPFTFDVNAMDLDLDNITFSDDAAQFDINASTGLISFTPTVVEVITATITACDDSGFPNNCTTQPFTLNVTQGPVYGVTLTDPADKIVNNATNAVYSLTLTNTGNVPDNYTLTYENPDNATTVTILPNVLTDLAAGASNAITVTIGDSTPGNYTVNVTATSAHGPSTEVSITTEVTAVPTQGVLLSDPTGQTVDSVTNAVYTITVTNTGNGVDSFDLSYDNQDNATTVSLNTSTVANLNPYESANVTLTVGDSDPGSYDVTVTAVSQTDASANDTTAVITTTITAAPGGIGGTVKDNFNNNLQNVNVSVLSTSLYGMTDAAGAYAISNVNSGTYSVTATPPDNSHLSQTKSGQVVNSGLITSVNFVLTQTGTINGNVYEFFNPTTPISSATVTVKIGSTTYGTDVTDASGYYEVTGLPPGTYDVTVSHTGYTTATKPLNDLLSGETRTIDFFMW